MFRFVVLFLIVWPAAPWAEDLCRADVNATSLVIDRTALDTVPDAAGLVERATGWPGRSLSTLSGRVPACDGETLIAYLSRDVASEDISGYCLLPDESLGYILVPGERGRRGRCARTTCERVTAARDGAASVVGTATDLVTGRDETQSRLQAVRHASGAAILSGSASSILSSLGAGASTAVAAALAAPVAASAAAVSVVAIGGAVYLCSGETE